jgi:DNA-directed RNA polymerase specialized sigma24 family protein
MANFGLSKEDYEQLSIAVKLGNELRFNELYLTHFKRIRNYTARRCNVFFAKQVNDATEMAFAVFLNQLKKEKIPVYGDLESYVVTIAKNDYAKQKQFTASPITDALANEQTEDALFDNADLVQLMEVFERLCVFCRQFLKYLHWEGRKQDELLEIMGFPTIAAVKTKHASIKLKLRNAFLANQTNQEICQTLCKTGESRLK